MSTVCGARSGRGRGWGDIRWWLFVGRVGIGGAIAVEVLGLRAGTFGVRGLCLFILCPRGLVRLFGGDNDIGPLPGM